MMLDANLNGDLLTPESRSENQPPDNLNGGREDSSRTLQQTSEEVRFPDLPTPLISAAATAAIHARKVAMEAKQTSKAKWEDLMCLARRLSGEVVCGLMQQLGEHHTKTLGAKNNLANILSELGERVVARRLYDEVIVGHTRQLGADHTKTLDAKFNLALLMMDESDRIGDQGWPTRQAEARDLLWQCVAGYTAAYGALHPTTEAARSQVLFRRCVAGHSIAYGASNPAISRGSPVPGGILVVEAVVVDS